MIFGESDGIVVAKEVSEDLTKMLGGADHVEFKVVPGGHGFPVPSSDEVVKLGINTGAETIQTVLQLSHRYVSFILQERYGSKSLAGEYVGRSDGKL